MSDDCVRAEVAGRRARGRGLHGPDRRARGRRHARVGLDDDRRRPRARRRASAGSATPTPTSSTAKLIESQARRRSSTGATRWSPQAAWAAMVAQTRNLGRPGIASMAIAAVDVALWDLKARLLGLPLCTLLGMARERVPVYGSRRLHLLLDRAARRAARRLGRAGDPAGQDEGRLASPSDDPRARARGARGDRRRTPSCSSTPTAPTRASRRSRSPSASAATRDVSWFEEPVSSDDLEGLRLLRDRAPAGMAIAAGEYGYDAVYFRRMLEAGAVDVLQADVTRCGGITELLRVDALCRARGAAALAALRPVDPPAPGAARSSSFVHLEYFHDHVRIEQHAVRRRGRAASTARSFPDLDRPGHRARAQARGGGALCGLARARRPPRLSARDAVVAQRPPRPDAADARRRPPRSARCRSGSRSTSSTSGARSATSGCGRRSRSRRR